MKVAVIGSRNLSVSNLASYLPKGVTEIVSGGARGIDQCARRYAHKCGLKYVEFLPEYDKYSKAAPVIRNRSIVDYADEVIAFWDGRSKGTKSVIDYCDKIGKKIVVYELE